MVATQARALNPKSARDLSSQEDVYLLKSIGNGNTEAVGTLYEKYNKMAVRMCIVYCMTLKLPRRL